MIPILYEKTERSFTTNGLCRLRDAVSVEVIEERNSIYECNFEYPIDGANYEMIVPGRIIGVTHDDTGDVQPFDIVSYSRPIDGIVSFHCVHISYRLKGYASRAQGDNYGNSLSGILAAISTDTGNVFNISADFESTGYMAACNGIPKSIRQYLGGIEGSVLDTFGGEYEWDRFNVILHKTRGKARDFSIRYGVNMIDFTDDVDYEDTFNVINPYWVGTDGKAIDTRVGADLQTYSGRNIVAPLDVTDKFDFTPSVQQLNAYGTSYLKNNKPNLPKQNIKVEFIRLQDSPEYENFASLLECSLCDSIKVEFPSYDMTGYFKIVRVVWDVLEGRYIEMELGTLSTSLSEALGISDTLTQGLTADVTAEDGKGSVTIGNVLIEWGSENVTTGSTAANSTYGGSATFTFTNEFKYAPQMMLTWGGNYGNQVSLNVYSVSTTDATVYGRTNTANSTRTIRWLAIGQKG